jgi:hypothetical protein
MKKEQKVKKPFYKKVWVWVIAVIVLVGVIGSNNDSDKSQVSEPAAQSSTNSNNAGENKTPEPTAKPQSKVNYQNFMNIKMGAKYEEVKAILGEGEVTSMTRIMKSESIMYSWINKNGSNMNATFSDGKMMMKAQFNLK